MKFSLGMKQIAFGLLAAAVVGCGGGDQPQPRARKVAPPPTTGGESAPAAEKATASAPKEAKQAEGWGTIKGVVLFEGTPPEPATLSIEKDQPYCVEKRQAAGKGPIVDETLIVNPESKAIQQAIVYMNVRGVPPIHPDYPQTKEDVAKAYAEKFAEMNGGLSLDEINSLNNNHEKLAALKAPVLLDQVYCQYVPHGIALRTGEKIIALNYEEVAHNILVESLKGNSSNLNMPPNTLLVYDWVAEPNPLSLKCSIHGWMQAYAMVFDHPYFDVTDEAGTFELKNVPAGEIDLYVRNHAGMIAGGRANPYKVTVKPDETIELVVKYDGKQGTVTKK